MPASEATRTATLFTVERGVAELVLNRPDKLNAMNDAMVAELIAGVDEAERSGARALLIRGEGRAFCSGRDLAGPDPPHEAGQAILADHPNPLIQRGADVPFPPLPAGQGA